MEREPPEAVAGTRATQSRIDYIDGLRAVAIIAVTFSHYYLSVARPGLPRWFDVFSMGYVGVHLFLLLSGLCVGWSYVGPEPKVFAHKDFFLRRAARILPPYYIALGFSLLFTHHEDVREFVIQVATHLTMTHNFLPNTVLQLNSAFWSLALESQLYLVFPLLLLLVKSLGWARALAVIILFQLAYRTLLIPLGTGYSETTFVLPWGVLGRTAEFALGVGIAHLIRTRRIPPVVARIALAVFLIAVLGARTLRKELGVSHPATDLVWTAAFAALVLAAACPGSYFRRLLETRTLVAIGKASYSIYLIHVFVIYLLVSRLVPANTPLDVCAYLAFPVVIATLLLCYPYYLWIERPLIRWARNLAEARRSSPA